MKKSKYIKYCIVLLAVLTITACDQFKIDNGFTYCYEDQYEREIKAWYQSEFTCVDPVYISMSELRENTQIEMSESQQIEKPGKLYGYDNYLFGIDHLKGIAVWQLDHEQTTQIGYIRIQGVTDVSVRNDFLYANSYVDLVRVDLNSANFTSIRLNDAFEYIYEEANFQLPSRTYFYYKSMSESRGIIIGYQERGSDDVVIF